MGTSIEGGSVSHLNSSTYVPHRTALRTDQEIVGHRVGGEGLWRGAKIVTFRQFITLLYRASEKTINTKATPKDGQCR